MRQKQGKNKINSKPKFKFSLVVGCGYTSQRDKCETDKIVATDIDKEKILVAKKKDSQAYFVVCNALFLPFNFKANVFEDVICTDVLEHLKEYGRVVRNLIELNPNKIYLRFPTREREALLAKVSKVYRTQHAGKIHVAIVKLDYVVDTLKNSGYEVRVDVTPATSTFTRCFLHSILEKFKIEYQIPELGLVTFSQKKLFLNILIRVSIIFGQLFGYIPYLLWKVLRIRTIHDNYIITCVKKSKNIEGTTCKPVL